MREVRATARVLRALALLTLIPATSTAQESATAMADECAGADASMRSFCLDAALALEAIRAGVGMSATQGSAVPGSASTLGRRMASSPRIALSLRGGLARARVAEPTADPRGQLERTIWPKTLEAQATVGVLEGWSLAPTVGGFLSLDLLGSLSLIGLSGKSRFGGSVQSIGYGARIGVFRESFTLPGVSVSAMRRHLGEVTWGENILPTGTELTFRPTVTSLRVAAAKDLLAFGVLGGWGWERYGGRSSLIVNRITTGAASSDDFSTDRQLVFGGLSYTMLVFQLSGEVGYARGWRGPAGSGDEDPGRGSIFGSLAARVTY